MTKNLKNKSSKTKRQHSQTNKMHTMTFLLALSSAIASSNAYAKTFDGAYVSGVISRNSSKSTGETAEGNAKANKSRTGLDLTLGYGKNTNGLYLGVEAQVAMFGRKTHLNFINNISNASVTSAHFSHFNAINPTQISTNPSISTHSYDRDVNQPEIKAINDALKANDNNALKTTTSQMNLVNSAAYVTFNYIIYDKDGSPEKNADGKIIMHNDGLIGKDKDNLFILKTDLDEASDFKHATIKGTAPTSADPLPASANQNSGDTILQDYTEIKITAASSDYQPASANQNSGDIILKDGQYIQIISMSAKIINTAPDKTSEQINTLITNINALLNANGSVDDVKNAIDSLTVGGTSDIKIAANTVANAVGDATEKTILLGAVANFYAAVDAFATASNFDTNKSNDITNLDKISYAAEIADANVDMWNYLNSALPQLKVDSQAAIIAIAKGSADSNTAIKTAYDIAVANTVKGNPGAEAESIKESIDNSVTNAVVQYTGHMKMVDPNYKLADDDAAVINKYMNDQIDMKNAITDVVTANISADKIISIDDASLKNIPNVNLTDAEKTVIVDYINAQISINDDVTNKVLTKIEDIFIPEVRNPNTSVIKTDDYGNSFKDADALKYSSIVLSSMYTSNNAKAAIADVSATSIDEINTMDATTTLSQNALAFYKAIAANDESSTSKLDKLLDITKSTHINTDGTITIAEPTDEILRRVQKILSDAYNSAVDADREAVAVGSRLQSQQGLLSSAIYADEITKTADAALLSVANNDIIKSLFSPISTGVNGNNIGVIDKLQQGMISLNDVPSSISSLLPPTDATFNALFGKTNNIDSFQAALSHLTADNIDGKNIKINDYMAIDDLQARVEGIVNNTVTIDNVQAQAEDVRSASLASPAPIINHYSIIADEPTVAPMSFIDAQAIYDAKAVIDNVQAQAQAIHGAKAVIDNLQGNIVNNVIAHNTSEDNALSPIELQNWNILNSSAHRLTSSSNDNHIIPEDGIMLSRLGSANVRLGYVALNDNILFYGLSGYDVIRYSNVSGNVSGLKLGAGFEYKLSRHLSARTEYTSTAFNASDIKTTMQSAKIGLSYHF